MVIVVGPLLVPAFALAIARKSMLPSLNDLAFGFVAVAFAGLARAVAARTDEWMAYAMGSAVVIALQTAIAVSIDNANDVQRLRGNIADIDSGHTPERIDQLRSMASDMLGNDPSVLQWSTSLLVGLTLVVGSVEVIRRER
jgi:hypothetical protein